LQRSPTSWCRWQPVSTGFQTLKATALRSALALTPGTAPERFALSAATLSLLAAQAENEPLLIVVDDAHWVDAPSLDPLLFTAHRLAAERIVLLFASRRDEPRFEQLARLELAGLDETAAGQLLEAAPGGLDTHVAEELIAASGGNPLALLELPGLLTEGQRSGREPLPDPLPVGPALQAAFVRRAEELPVSTRRALVIAAAAGDGQQAMVAATLDREGLALEALEHAESAGFLTLDAGDLRFRHPVIRAALYAAAPPAARRSAHRSLADAAATQWLRAWHLSATALGPDEEIAARLEEAALEARSRGAYADAARAAERAAHLSKDDAVKARRLLAAAGNLRLAGREESALELLDRALTLEPDPRLRADIEHLRARIRLARAPSSGDRARLLAAAASVEPVDPSRATLMYLDAALTATELEDAETADAAVARMRETVRRTRPMLAHELDVLLSGWVDEIAPDAVLAYSPRWPELLAVADDLAVADRLVLVAGGASYVGAEYEQARLLLVRIAEAARAASAGWILAQALAELALLDFRRSDWRSAVVEGEEALRLARETERPLDAVRALTCLVRIEGAQGREYACRRHAVEAWSVADEIGARALADWHCNVGLGLLELGLGNPDKAVVHLELPAGDVDRGQLAPGIFRAAGDLVEAYLRSGDRPKAERLLDEFERRARAADRAWALAVAARCRGLLGPDDDIDRHFLAALEHHERTPVPFDRARTRLAYGERLRRARRRVEARRELRAAQDELDRIGATPWARRAQRELAASGERLATRGGEQPVELTPQELQLAQIVAAGATNKEAAAALFVSPKTVEAHLGTIYRKLGLRSRTELAARLATHP
jgi:DNA-binding CsgD family transcriptional regulator